jgi:hypothetical protein
VKKLWIASLFAGVLALTATAGEWSGVLTDAKCKHTDGSAKSIKCAEACIKGGQPVVFVDTATNQVYKVANPEKGQGHYGHKVKVTGEVANETLTIESVKMDH